MSSHQTSRSLFQSTSCSVRFTTKTFFTLGIESIASSTAAFSPNGLPFRKPPSAVITTLADASSIRLRNDSAEKPPKTTECGAPIRAQANIDTTASGIIGI